ncbi:MAG: hypothetical protein JSR76_03555 [Verrucomicrobia bacterium]|nr:hypothetical protein [Verrucomicrobiota bacterium]
MKLLGRKSTTVLLAIFFLTRNGDCMESATDRNEKELLLAGPRKDTLLVRDINKQVALKLKKEKNLRSIGSGAEMMYEIKLLGLSFNYYNEIDIDKGRELLVFAASEYLDAINTNVELRPYLDHWPFTANDIEIDIGILKPTGKEVGLEKIDFLTCEKNELKYYPNKGDIPGMPPPLLTENYQEAVKIIEESKKQPSTPPLTKISADQISREKPA